MNIAFSNKRSIFVLLLAVIAAIVVAGLLLIQSANRNVAHAQNAQNYDCHPTEVAVVGDRGMDFRRVHIRCSQGYDNSIFYFAFPIDDDPVMADMIITIGSTAIANDLNVNILFDVLDTDAPRYGCVISDCREIIRISMSG